MRSLDGLDSDASQRHEEEPDRRSKAAVGGPARFPSEPHATASSYFTSYSTEVARAAASVDLTAVERAAAILLGAYTAEACVFACGNGGSAAIANHLGCDHLKGIRTRTDLSPRVVSLSCNVELLTAIANDLAYEDVFAFQLESQARPGDVLIAISASGKSPNILRALGVARDKDLRTIAMTGFGGGEASSLADVALHVDSSNYGVVEDVHQGLMHVLAQYLRHSRMTSETISTTTF